MGFRASRARGSGVWVQLGLMQGNAHIEFRVRRVWGLGLSRLNGSRLSDGVQDARLVEKWGIYRVVPGFVPQTTLKKKLRSILESLSKENV